MITTGAKLWFAFTAFALAAAAVYFLATAGDDGGAITLLFISAGAAVIGSAAIAVRDGDTAISGEGAREPVVVRSALPAPWPALSAVGAGLAIVGLAVGGLLLYVGLGIMGGALVEWMVQGWAERSTANPAYNRALRNRIMFPLEVPVLGFLGVGFIILSFSRVLLALPDKNVSTIVALVVAALITAGAFTVAYRPRIGAGALSWVLAIAAVVLFGAGIVGGVAGERTIERHGDEHESTETQSDGEGSE